MELFNYKDNCRLCLKRHTDFMKNIFTCCVEGYQDTLVQNIFALFKVELNPHEDYPQFICRKCLTELENILLFQEDLQNNQEFLLGLFRAAYPNYIEKDFHTVQCSKDCGTKFKSIAVNTDPWVDLEDLGDSEYVRVPVDFLKQFSPQISLQPFNRASCVNNKPAKIKEKVQENSLRSDTELRVNICKYCRKVFRSQALVNTHYKEVHKLEEGKKNKINSKTTNGTQKSLSEKFKNEKDKKVLYANKLKLHAQQISSPQMDLQNNNTADIKEEFLDSPSSHQVDEMLLTEPVFQQKQALFLQNFNLIAKQEAALLKDKQKALQHVSKNSNFKKQMKKLKKSLGKPLKSKDKLIVKPHQIQVENKRPETAIVRRSMEFLKRYGWRKLNSSSRRGTPISNNNNNLFEKSLATKSIPRKINQKNSLKSSVSLQLIQKVGVSKMAKQEKDCEPKDTLKAHLPKKIKRSNSVESFKNRILEKIATQYSQSSGTTGSIKKSPTSSATSYKDTINPLNKPVDNIEDTKLGIVIKSEPLTSCSLIKNDDNFKQLATSSSMAIYDNSYIPTKPVTGRKVVEEEPITNPPIVKTRSKHRESCKDVDQKFNSERKLPNLVIQRKSEELLDTHYQEPHVDFKDIDVKFKPFGSNDRDSFCPTDDFQVKKELRIQLERERSAVNGLNGSSDDVKFDKSNFEVSEQRPDMISYLEDAKFHSTEFSGNKGRPRQNKIVSSTNDINLSSPGCSTDNNNLSIPRKRGRPLKNLGKESVNLNTSSDSKIWKFNNWLNKTTQSNETLTLVTKKQGRPRKVPISKAFSPSSIIKNTALDDFIQNNPISNIKTSLLNKTRSESPYLPPTREVKREQLSTLQDLTERFEKEDNISLRMKLRKTASCESLNSLKYDTQELDENFQIKAEAIDQSNDLKCVPDNDNFFSYDSIIRNNLEGVLIKNEEVYHERVVNVDLEDKEVQMVFLISDDEEDVDFDNDTGSVINKYLKSKRLGSQSNQISKKDLADEKSSLCTAVNDHSDCVAEKKQTHRSQTCLPLSKPKLSTKNSSNSLIGARPRFIETTPVKRKGRPPNKFSPTVYTVKRLKNTAEQMKRNLSDSCVDLLQKKLKSGSRSLSQSKTNSCAKELFNEVRKRGRPRKKENLIVSTVIGKSSLPKKMLSQKQEHISTSKQLIHNRVSPRNSFCSFSRN